MSSSGGGGVSLVDRYPYVAATFNLIISAAGAGLLSYPFAMKSAGIGLTIMLTAVFAVLNAYGLSLLGTSKHAPRCQ